MKEYFSTLSSVYLNSAYFGPLPKKSTQLIQSMTQRLADPSFWAYDNWMSMADQVRNSIGKLFAINPENIAHGTSVSDLMNIIVAGLSLGEDDVVATVQGNYPSGVLPWMHLPKHRFKLLEVPASFTLQDLQKRMPENCKVFCLSWVAFNTGFKANILEIGTWLKQQNILFVVDASQYLGAFGISAGELDVIDCLLSVSYKWMCCPYGHAFGYFSPKAQQKIDNKFPNWIKSKNSVRVDDLLRYTLETRPGARKYDRGQTPNLLLMAGALGSLEVFQDIGLNKISKHNETLVEYFYTNMRENPSVEIVTPRASCASIVSLKLKDTKLEQAIKSRNIDVSIREGNVRISFHLFNTIEDVQLLIQAFQ